MSWKTSLFSRTPATGLYTVEKMSLPALCLLMVSIYASGIKVTILSWKMRGEQDFSFSRTGDWTQGLANVRPAFYCWSPTPVALFILGQNLIDSQSGLEVAAGSLRPPCISHLSCPWELGLHMHHQASLSSTFQSTKQRVGSGDVETLLVFVIWMSRIWWSGRALPNRNRTQPGRNRKAFSQTYQEQREADELHFNHSLFAITYPKH